MAETETPGRWRGVAGWKIASALLLLLAACTGLALGLRLYRRRPPPLVPSPSEYSMVALTNGQVFFGKLEGFGTAHPVLREVFYIQSNVNPESKERSHALIKRGKEAHQPEYMVLNMQHVILIEPVGKGSRVAQLIAQAK